ncbi:MAG: T9SS type A sorting domain-containing protein [Bacteroidales bacterium]|nr:T9SS type A sorting domain-containing protein [Bacteroidales bacterium]
MKKTLLFVLALLLSTAMFAQNRASLLHETFDGSSMPEGWTINGLGTSNWSIVHSNKAGGDANELKINYYPSFNGISRVVMTPVNLTDVESVVVSFKHYLDNFSDAHNIGIATSSDGSTWNTGWSQTYNSTGGGSVSELISTPDMGKENVYFCIYYEGYSYNINDWYFDDIEIFTQENLDLKLVSIDVPNIVNAGVTEVPFTVQNMGATTIESFTIETVDISADYCGTTDPQTFETNLAPFEIAQFTLQISFDLNPGTYNIPIDIIDVNGTVDDDTNNNGMDKTFNVSAGIAQRIPMIEHFSSSTCPPCVNVNYAMANLTAANPGKYTYTKYPCYWPGSGDPYCNDDVRTRVSFYACNAAPQTFLDGIDQGFTSVTQGALDEHYATPAFADVRGAFNVQGNTINVTADFMSYFNMSGINAYISINEKTTTGNVGTNGETEFHHILMKMLEDGNGTPLELNIGEYKRFEYSFDMSSTFVEEMNDLEVSLWIQDPVSREIFNSRFAYEYTEHCYPVQNLTADFSEDGSAINVAWEAPETGTPTGYNIYINGVLMEENYTSTSYTNNELATELYNMPKNHYVEVRTMYADDKSSVSLIDIFASGVNVSEINETSSFNVYPNPASDVVKVTTVNGQQTTVRIYNILGMLVEEIEINSNETEINVSDYNPGIYFFNIQTENGNVTKKIVVE